MTNEEVARGIALALVGIGLASACSGTAENKATCPIVGTYTVTGTVESGDCSSPSTDESGASSTTYTITKLDSGDPTSDFGIEIQGLRGGCIGDQIDTCKVQGKCDLRLKDPVSPSDDIGTYQFSWTFDANGFNGTYAVRLPPAKTLPKGCTENGSIVGTRR